MMHPLKVFIFFVVASLVTMFAGVGASLSGDLAWQSMSGLVSALMVGAFALGGGMGITIFSRGAFGLMQTGRIIQWPAFIGSTWEGFTLAAWLFAGTLAVTSGLLASLFTFGLAFGWGYLRKEIPWKGRTWLPMKMPNRK